MKNTILLFIVILISAGLNAQIAIISDQQSPRVNFGSEKLSESLAESGFKVEIFSELPDNTSEIDQFIYVSEKDSDWYEKYIGDNYRKKVPETKEGFRIYSEGDKIFVVGHDASGTLYGAMELTERLTSESKFPLNIDFEDQPEMILRGTAIGLQKTTLLPGRSVYEYPYTPENFPWFYDKELWIDYLDVLVENRYNSLYLWNGHPFASLIKLDDYPYALEVDENTFKKNEEIFEFLTKEANKRGIWVIQMFYNIIVSKPFAEHHGIKTQERSRKITPLLEDYTRKSIAAFIEKYPNVGLLVALGEAMSGIENDINWFTNTVIPGVKDGLGKLNRTDEPPIILRAHDTDAPRVIEKAFPLYKNLFTMHKYNGESLTTYEPRGPWTKIHKDLSALASIHISNVHVLANLEPFRYGSPDFIQKSVKAMHNVHGANALHLYPQVSYWDWPYTADKTEPRLLEMDRDWIWYKAWGRYTWDQERDRKDEIRYWSKKLADKYGSDIQTGRNILKAYEETGEIAPKTLRRFGITEGNRQTLLLGMFMSQLVNPYKWRVYPGFYESTGPKGEILIEYANKEWKGEPHIGETPPQIISEILAHGEKAVEAIEKAAGKIKEDQSEFERLKNDIYAYNAFANFFAEKVKAAMLVLEYDYSGDVSTLKKAFTHLEKSLEYYKELVALTKDTYLYANSMQTGQRRIPIGGNDGNFKTWKEMLPLFKEELNNFKNNIQKLGTPGQTSGEKEKIEPWSPATVQILDPDLKRIPVEIGQLVYDRMDAQILKVAPELNDLDAVKFGEQEQIKKGTYLKFKNNKPVKLIIGYFDTQEEGYLTPPTLETNAAGNTRGQADIVLVNAVELDDYAKINIHTYKFDEGENELQLDKGRVLVLGFIEAGQNIKSRDVGIMGDNKKSIDWLFE